MNELKEPTAKWSWSDAPRWQKVSIVLLTLWVLGTVIGNDDDTTPVAVAAETVTEAVAETPAEAEAEVEVTTTEAPTTTTTTAAPTTTTTRPPTTTTTEYVLTESDMEAIYVAYLRSWTVDQPYNIVDWVDDDDLIELGWLICETLDSGASEVEVGLVMYGELDGDVETAGTLMGAAMASFCPEYSF